jgi:transcriptional regulator GlxA family with amidase domain
MVSAAMKHTDGYAVPETAVLDPRIQRVIHFINANLHRRITRAELSTEVNLSTARLSHLFKSETGVAPGEYLTGSRMEKASQLLTTAFMSIKQVMAEVGYTDKGNFARSFKRHFQVTSSEFRKRALRP